MSHELAYRIEALNRRREIALARLDAYIDVTSAWRGRYEDDDRDACIAWICDVIGGEWPEGGWLYGKHATEKIFGWYGNDRGQWCFRAKWRPASWPEDRRHAWPCTRKEFRELAHVNGVSLPSRHATLYLTEKVIG